MIFEEYLIVKAYSKGGTYNFDDLTESDWQHMSEMRYYYNTERGVEPPVPFYPERIVFSCPLANLQSTFLDCHRSFVANTMLSEQLKKINLAPHSLHTIKARWRGKEDFLWHYYFYTSMKEYVDFDNSVFYWVVANKSLFDPVTNTHSPIIIRPASIRNVEDLKFLNSNTNGETVWYEKLVFSKEVAACDMFELDFGSREVLMKKSIVQKLAKYLKGIDVLDSRVGAWTAG